MQPILKEVKEEVQATRKPWYYISKAGRVLLIAYAIQLTLFGLLAWWVHYHPILPVDVAITHEFQENPAPWLKIAMIVVSYPGSTLILPVLILLAAIIFWLLGLLLEAVFVIVI